MNNIDVSTETENLVSEKNEDVNIDLKKYAELYQKIVLDKINAQLEVIPSNSATDGFTSVNDSEETIPVSLLEVDCKGLLGTHFCEIESNSDILISKHDKIIVKFDDCHEIATVKEVGLLASKKSKCQNCSKEDHSKFVRLSDENDENQLKLNLNDELKARPIFFELVKKYELNMKLVDIHYQFDRKKLFFFYTSDGRVDFRELAKSLASKFKTRIELRQIGVRDEAQKVGGMGTCGREFCCSSFLNNFKRITTQLANEQNLTANMSKLSGPCGKLKCCLSYEVDEVDLEKIAQARLDAQAES